MSRKTPSSAKAIPLLHGGGVLGSFLALIGASCCIVPILLVNLGVATSLVAKLAWLTRIQPVLFGISAIILIASAVLAVRRGGARWVFWVWWSVGALFLIMTVLLPLYEFQMQRTLLDWMRG
jgi:mercuric ion transport protein